MARKPKVATPASPSPESARAALLDVPLRGTRSLLRPLGIVGYDAAEPALLAAIATEAPLLLVSDHGAAKSLLLERLAGALVLDLRHYNASLLQYDDLVGFPVPQDDGSVRFAAPPGAIWGAEAVFLDEIGRCRADVANKLFPIVHERRVQGVRLDALRHRWAATNPPEEAMDDASDSLSYAGVDPLDPALADRFDWVVTLPGFAQLADADRLAIVRGDAARVHDDAGALVRELVEATRALIPGVEAQVGARLTEYTLSLVGRLAQARLARGGRRAATLRRNFVAGWAAHLALGREPGERALVAILRASIPDRVRTLVSDHVLVTAHRHAWDSLSLDADSPERLLLAVADPARRCILAATLPGLDRLVRGEAITTALPQVPRRAAPLLAWLLLGRLGHTADVPAATLEVLADLVAPIAAGGVEYTVRGGSEAANVVPARSLLAREAPSAEVGELLLNIIMYGHAKALPTDGLPAPVARNLASFTKWMLDRHREWSAALRVEQPAPSATDVVTDDARATRSAA